MSNSSQDIRQYRKEITETLSRELHNKEFVATLSVLAENWLNETDDNSAKHGLNR